MGYLIEENGSGDLEITELTAEKSIIVTPGSGAGILDIKGNTEIASGKNLKLAGETANRAAYIDASNQLKAHSTVTDTKLGYLSNVTSDIQSQINTVNSQLSGHIGIGGATHPAATSSVAGFMSATDKSKLDGIANNANNYVHPDSNGYWHVPAVSAGTDGQFLKCTSSGSIDWADAPSGGSGVTGSINVSDPAGGYWSLGFTNGLVTSVVHSE